jgi:hypothetical protein
MKVVIIAFILEGRTLVDAGDALSGTARRSRAVRLATTPLLESAATSSRPSNQSPPFWTWFIPNPLPSSNE